MRKRNSILISASVLVFLAAFALYSQQPQNLIQVAGAALGLGQTTMSASLPVAIASNQSSIPVTGTFWQATQPISAASLPLPTGASTAANQCGASTGALCFEQPSDGTHSMPMGDASARTIHVTADNASLAVIGTFWQTTQPVSVASLPLPSGAATSANQCGASLGSPCEIGGQGSGSLVGDINCDTPFKYDAATNGKTQLIALSSGKKIYVCGISITQSTTSAVTVSIGSGTGTNCATTYTAETPAWPLTAPTSVGPTGLVLPQGKTAWFATNASEELCVSTNAGVSVQIIGMAAQF